MNFDFVGDIHGHAEALEALLRQLGYSERNGAWRHPSRTMGFVGDFIDRGPEQLRVIDMVRRMLDAGSAIAVSGNHEANASALATEDPDRRGRYLRIRGSKNMHQHQVFLDAVGLDSPLHRELVTWFKSLPLWLDLGEVRVVHACWHPEMIDVLKPYVDANNCPTEDGFYAINKRDTPAYWAAETLLKGVEVPLPAGMSFFDKDGVERTKTRTRWWDKSAMTFRAAAIVEGDPERLPETALPAEAVVPGIDDTPIMIGHYWLRADQPYLTSEKVACLDFSVAKGGFLCSYAFDGEPVLDASKLRWVRPGMELEPVSPLPVR